MEAHKAPARGIAKRRRTRFALVLSRGREKVTAWLRGLELSRHAGRAQSDAPTLDAPARDRLVADMEAALGENIVDFWLPRCLDREHGGYRQDFDSVGRSRDLNRKRLVVQARMLWFLSRAAAGGFETTRNPASALRSAADEGFLFLKDRLWDHDHGGFFWEVDRAGTTVKHGCKDAYGQAFALLALSQYALVGGSTEAKDLADNLFATLLEKMHDAEYGGYTEFLASDWTPADRDARRYTDTPGASRKSMNTHLHLLEALTTYYRLSPTPLARERLLELLRIQTTAAMRKRSANTFDRFERDWSPVLDERYDQVSYGHDLENVHLVMDAVSALGLPAAPIAGLLREVFDQALEHGFDWRDGGFFFLGRVGRRARRLEKVWWVQAEGMLCALRLYQRFQRPRDLDVFLRTWQFIDRKVIDREHGEWYDTVMPDGSTATTKGHAWKSAYHNGRSLMDCLEILRALPT